MSRSKARKSVKKSKAVKQAKSGNRTIQMEKEFRSSPARIAALYRQELLPVLL